ncbi:MAG TPA: asparagine synthase (glutamine-hydrolyzing) [Candidatus Limnocylindrales bacterium]|nr:asparagine synthase (glutamine-hydrolyzing) [Candidatus Limnocylindrales bacterium]
MCGIAGFADITGKISAEALGAASRAIAHRGPDDAGTQILPMREGPGSVGLANRRLAILDLSPAGHQPMSDPATGNWIAYNGEVFNFHEVRRELERANVQFASHSDTEVILKAYAAWGLKCLDRFRGMFAFAIWDNAAQRLVIARDRLGKKPLYYYQGQGFLLFASEVRALLATTLVPGRIDQDAVKAFLAFGSVYDPATIVQGVRALPAGSYLVWQNGSLQIQEYWDLSAIVAASAEHAPRTEEQALDRLHDLLLESIHLRMVSDVPVGVFLSGGIDSSAIVAALCSDGSRKVNTFSIVFKEAEYSEAEYSSLIARRFKTEHHEIELAPEDFLGSVPDAIQAMDQPSLDGFNTYTVSCAVRRAGLKVALSGQGGDELFGGYGTFREVPRMEKFMVLRAWLPSPVRSALSAALLAAGSGDRARTLAALAGENGSLPHPYFLARMLFVPEQQRQLLKQSRNGSGALEQGMAESLRRARSFDPVNRVSFLELRNYMANTLLRDADCMSMATGLEVRVPLLDHRLVEYALSIPGAIKLDKRTPKHLLVKGLRGLLPDEIVHRPKKGFTLPFEKWLRGQLKSTVDAALTNIGRGALADVLQPAPVREVWDTFQQGKTSWSRPWALYVLDRWCQINL